MSRTETLTSLPKDSSSGNSATESRTTANTPSMTPSNATELEAPIINQEGTLKRDPLEMPTSDITQPKNLKNDQRNRIARNTSSYSENVKDSTSTESKSQVTITNIDLAMGSALLALPSDRNMDAENTESVPSGDKNPPSKQTCQHAANLGLSHGNPGSQVDDENSMPASTKSKSRNSPPGTHSPSVRRKRQKRTTSDNSMNERSLKSTKPELSGKDILSPGELTRKRRRSVAELSKDEEPSKKHPLRKASSAMARKPQAVGKKTEPPFKSPFRSVKRAGKPKKVKPQQSAVDFQQLPDNEKNTPARVYYLLHQSDLEEAAQEVVKRAIKRSTTPDPSSKAHKVWTQWKALRRPSFSAKTQQAPHVANENTHGLFSHKVEEKLQAFFHILRAQLVEDNIWDAIQSCHSMLNWGYEEAEKLLKSIPVGQSTWTDDAKALELREEIAGYWCLYAHVFIQISETDAFLDCKDSRVDELTRGLAAVNSMEEGLWDQAIAVLASCTSCPFVGNHAAITLSLARLRLKQRKGGIPRPFTSLDRPDDAKTQRQIGKKGTSLYYERSLSAAQHWLKNIGNALDICRAGIDRASLPPEQVKKAPSAQTISCDDLYVEDKYLDIETTRKRAASIIASMVCPGQSNPFEVAEDQREASLLLTALSNLMELPQRLKRALLASAKRAKHKNDNPLEIPYMFVDRRSARLIFMESNCISRMQQTVATYSPDARLQLVCDPERLASQRNGRASVFKHIHGMDGVMWDDCLFFQSMTGAFVDQITARKCWLVKECNFSPTADFFTATSFYAINKSVDDDAVGFDIFPSDSLCRDVSYPCAKCCKPFNAPKEMKAHSKKCKGEALGHDILQCSWEEMQHESKKHPRGSSVAFPGHSENKCFDIQCACSSCSAHIPVLATIEQEVCWRHPAEEGADFARMDYNQNRLSGKKGGADTSFDDEDKHINDDASQALDLEEATRKSTANRILCDVIKEKTQHNTTGKSAKDCDDVGGRRVQPLSLNNSEKSSQSKRPIKENLNMLFEDEVEEGDRQESDDDEPCAHPSKTARLSAPSDPVPQYCPARSQLNERETRSDGNFADVEYPCRVCQQNIFLSKKAREDHESSCKGPSGRSDALVLEEQWPSFPTNHQHIITSRTAAFEKPCAEGPTPRKPPRDETYVNGRDVPVDRTDKRRKSSRGQVAAGRPRRTGCRSAGDGSGSRSKVANPLSEKNTLIVNCGH